MSKLIPLSRGLHAIVDDEDFEFLSQWKWHAFEVGRKTSRRVYAANGRGGARLFMHRLVMAAPAGVPVDHKNRDTLDCRRINLRVATHSDNALNRRASLGGSSRHKGVSWDAARGLWQARFRERHLGRFEHEDVAAMAYNVAAANYNKDFSLLNEVRMG